MIAVIFAVIAAASNAFASVLQRRAAREVPEQKAFRLALVLDLIRRPVWLLGIVALISGFVFQAAALSRGALALVQPTLVVELPFTMLLIAWMFGINLDTRSWLAVALMTVGLVTFLASAAPGPGHHAPDSARWLTTTFITVGAVIGLVMVARLMPGVGRAVALGIATGIGFAFTATFMKESTTIFDTDAGVLFRSWELYAMVFTGLCSLFLLQNTLQSGPLVAAQPALTISDPVSSILYGTLLFGEYVRTGAWILLEAAGIALIIYGSYLLSKSPPIRAQAQAARRQAREGA